MGGQPSLDGRLDRGGILSEVPWCADYIPLSAEEQRGTHYCWRKLHAQDTSHKRIACGENRVSSLLVLVSADNIGTRFVWQHNSYTSVDLLH